MADCSIYIKQNFKTTFNNYLLIDDSERYTIEEKQIIYGNMRFEDRGEWCLITTIPGEVYCEEILLQMSFGNELIYFYSDEDYLGCEFIVIINNVVIRKFLHYSDTPELNQDIGKMPCEKSFPLKEWNDLDLLIERADISAELLFNE